MTTKNGMTVLRARIEQELNDIRDVVKLVEDKFQEIGQTTPDDFIVAGFASCVHSFYNGLENIFKLIAEYVDNFVLRGEAWHKDLLKQMTLDLQGIRPAVLSAELGSALQGYLEFRHFFRHSYSFYIEWGELKPKVERVRSTFDQVEVALRNFFIFLTTAGEQLE